MKLLISLFLTHSALASPINVFHEDNNHEATMYRDILKADYMIPEDLIAMKSVKDCERVKKEGKLDLCLKNNGDLLVVSVDRSFVNESLKVFKAP